MWAVATAGSLLYRAGAAWLDAAAASSTWDFSGRTTNVCRGGDAPPPPVGGVWRHSRFVPIARGDGEAVPVHLFNTLGGGGGAGGEGDGFGCHILRGCDDAVCNFLVALGSEVDVVSVCVLFHCRDSVVRCVCVVVKAVDDVDDPVGDTSGVE